MKLLRAVATIGGWTILSRVLGFVRDLSFAFVAGAGVISDAFFVAFRFPNMFRALFAEGAMNSAFVPTFTKHLKNHGKDEAQDFTQNAFTLMFGFMVMFILVGIILMPQIMAVQASGYQNDGEKFALTISLARVMFPYLGFMIMNALFAGVLNSLGKFSAPAGSPALLNVCSLVVLALIFMEVIPLTGYELAIGVLVAGVLQVSILLWACLRAGFKPYGIRLGILAPTKVFLKRALPVVFGASLLQLNILVGTILATTLASGTVSYLYYADRLVQLPLGVIGIAISVALLPMLSRSIESGDRDVVQQQQSDALIMGLFLTLPATMAFLFIGYEIIITLFMHGQFDLRATQATTLALQGFAYGLPAFVLIKVLTPAFFARGDTKTPVKIAVLCMVINILLSLYLMQEYAHYGLAVATSISAWVNVMLLYGMMRFKRFDGFTSGTVIQILKIILCSAVMGVVLLGLKAYMGDMAIQESNEKILSLIGLVIVGKLVYFICILLTGTLTTKQIKHTLTRR